MDYRHKPIKNHIDVRITGEAHHRIQKLKVDQTLRTMSDAINYLFYEIEELKQTIEKKDEMINKLRDEIIHLCKVLENKKIPVMDIEPTVYLKIAMSDNNVLFDSDLSENIQK